MTWRNVLSSLLTAAACNIMADGFWRALAAYTCLYFAMALMAPASVEKP